MPGAVGGVDRVHQFQQPPLFGRQRGGNVRYLRTCGVPGRERGRISQNGAQLGIGGHALGVDSRIEFHCSILSRFQPLSEPC
ncbi:hypothetical protein AB0A63_29575 [Lentzea sp. NPDC042327]|uniref:hypothetical protein n=1 Tax=Lentzea sp. NPDC042327 TaxID=3154801 RepID=UPI00340B5D64